MSKQIICDLCNTRITEGRVQVRTKSFWWRGSKARHEIKRDDYHRSCWRAVIMQARETKDGAE